MADYKYSKDVLKELKVGPFLNEVKLREKMIAEADDSLPQADFNANDLEKKLHPPVQFAEISEVIERFGAKSYVLVPKKEMGTEKLAYFRAGQFVSVALDIDGTTANKPYTICSSPKDALGDNGTSYMLTIQENPSGSASAYIPKNWKEGTTVVMSGPLGDFYYQGLRDAKNVVAIAGGSGITPFYSMAAAIADGVEDFNLTIIYGARTSERVLLKNEIEQLAARGRGKIRLVPVLSEEMKFDSEYGFVTSDIVKKYAPKGEDYSVFVCGPKAMYAYLKQELKKLELPQRRIRYELQGQYGDPTNDPDYPFGLGGKEFSIDVLIRGEHRTVPCKAEQSLLQAMEAAGIRVPSDCRSGSCGFCRSRLISGDIYVPKSQDGRRMADAKFGWIHPCCTYAVSDIKIEVFPMLGV